MANSSPTESSAGLSDVAPGQWELVPSARCSATGKSVDVRDPSAADGFLRQFPGDFMIMSRLREVLALTDDVFLMTDDSVIEILSWRLASGEVKLKNLGAKDGSESGGSGGGGGGGEGDGTTDEEILAEAQQLFNSIQMKDLRAAHKADRTTTILFGKYSIQYQPQGASGKSSSDGFTIGKKAFASDTELQKTLLQELYRLHHGKGDKAAAQFVASSIGQM
jgi:hypothetical protein